MRRGAALLVGLTFLLVAFAGCTESDQDQDPDPGPKEGERFHEDTRISIDNISETARDWVPTLDEPPELALSEYWKVEVALGWGLGDRVVDMVAAGQEDDHWLIGMPTHDFSNDIMVLHIPGMGQVKKDTLGFEAHDVWFDAVRFPVKEGDTWTTGFMGEGNVEAEVTRTDGLNATIEMTGSYDIVIEYDAAIRGIKSFIAYAGDDTYGSYEVVEHGFDWHKEYPEWDGIVTVPHMSDLLFCHGSIAGLPLIEDCSVAEEPSEGGTEFEVRIDPDYDRVSFANIILGLVDPLPGHYEVKTVAPDETEYLDTLTPLDGTNGLLASYKHDMPGGTWTIEAVAAGPGQAFMEGIGYHVYDVELPKGRILPSIGAHEHGQADGH